jgi:hypothetical protein
MSEPRKRKPVKSKKPKKAKSGKPKKKVGREPTHGSVFHLQHLALSARHSQAIATLKSEEAKNYAEVARHRAEAIRSPAAAAGHLEESGRRSADAMANARAAEQLEVLKYKSLPADLAAAKDPKSWSGSMDEKAISRSAIHNCVQIHVGAYSAGTELKKIYLNNALEQACRDCATCSGMNYADVEDNPPTTVGAFEQAVVTWYLNNHWKVT